MIRGILALLGAMMGSVGLANPRMANHETYIASEDLRITIVEDDADFVGRFIFKSAPNGEYQQPEIMSEIEIPIWIPAQPDTHQPALERFLATFPSGQLAWIKEQRPLVDQVVGLSISAGGQEVKYRTFSPYAYGKRGLPRSWTRPDLVCLFFSQAIDSKLLAGDGAEVVLKYHQPLVRVGDKRLLFYLPIFSNLDERQLWRNRQNYKVTVRASNDDVLHLTSEVRLHQPATPDTLIIFPENELAIEVEVLHRAK